MKNKIVVLNLFNLTLRLNGFPIAKARTELDTILSLSESEYETFLATKKEEILFKKQ
jgi:phenylacetate-CoA ligase